MKNRKTFAILALSGVMALSLFAMSAIAQIVVTPTNMQGWFSDDTRPGGTINYVADSTAPGDYGALQLITDATTAAKAQYMHFTTAPVPLASVTELSYDTRQISGPVHAAASYQLQVCLDGITGTTCNGFATLVYEPYWNGTVLPTVWQSWDVDAGNHWSSRTYTNGTCAVVNGAGGPPFYTIAGLAAACPNAVAFKFGVNVGTFNPGYNIHTDFVNFNGTIYDFEPYLVATNKDQCKNGGWQTYRRADGSTFRNQGDCIQYVNTGN